MLLAPWVFGSVTIVFTTLPAHGIGDVAGLQMAVPGLLAALALAAGYGVQSTGRRLHGLATTRYGDGRTPQADPAWPLLPSPPCCSAPATACA